MYCIGSGTTTSIPQNLDHTWLIIALELQRIALASGCFYHLKSFRNSSFDSYLPKSVEQMRQKREMYVIPGLSKEDAAAITQQRKAEAAASNSNGQNSSKKKKSKKKAASNEGKS